MNPDPLTSNTGSRTSRRRRWARYARRHPLSSDAPRVLCSSLALREPSFTKPGREPFVPAAANTVVVNIARALRFNAHSATVCGAV